MSLFPLVLKSPLSTIPQFAASRTALPFMFTPSMLDVGGPSVYKQPLFGPPLVFVATARAVTTCLRTPKIFMKYVSWTSDTYASTYFGLPAWGPVVGPEAGSLIWTHMVATVALDAVQLLNAPPALSVKPFVAEAACPPAITPPLAG